MTTSMIVSAFLSGILGSMGLGGGTILIIYLTYFRSIPQTEAQGINLVCFIPIAILAAFVYSKQKLADIKSILPLIIFAAVGAIIGFLLLEYIPDGILSKLFGGFLIMLSVKGMFERPRRDEHNSTFQ